MPLVRREVLTRTLAACGVVLAIAVAWKIVHEYRIYREGQKIASAEAWGASLGPELANLEGIAQARIVVPQRTYAYKLPDWFLSASAIAIDEAAEQRLRQFVAERSNGRSVSFQIHNCYGDRELFEKMSRD